MTERNITEAELNRLAQAFCERIGQTEGLRLVMSMTDKATLVGVLGQALQDIGISTQQENAWSVWYRHIDCPECEDAAERAIAFAERDGLSFAWSHGEAGTSSDMTRLTHLARVEKARA